MLLSNYPDTHDPISGIFYKRIVEELINRGIKVIIISPRPNLPNFVKANKKQDLKQTTQIFNKLQIFRPRYIPLPTFLSKRLKVFVLKNSIDKCIKQNHLDFDIVDSRNAFPWCYIGYKIAYKYSKPAISAFIGDDINVDIFKSSYIFNCVKKIVENTATITVSSELMKKTEENFSTKSVNVIYDGIKYNDLEAYREINKNSSQNYILTIGYVGQLTKEKGCITLLEIIKKTGKLYNWIIIGAGPFYNSFKGNKNVELTGKLSPEEVLKYYQKFDICIFPSKNEGIPNVLKEAAFFEIPIIASAVGGIPEMTDEGKLATLIEDFENPNCYINALKNYSEDNLEFLNKAKQLKNFTKLKFDITVNVSKLIALYNLEISTFMNQTNPVKNF
jgi:glycosyltransferase involved in cell wall biosynthesis